ncbi:MAG: glucokinase, partial [Candidatus Xenobia bacterium]
MILAGDIGGTKTVLALYEVSGGRLSKKEEQSYPSRDHASLELIIEKFLGPKNGNHLEAGCFGIAGAVVAGTARTTNLPWQMEEKSLAKTLEVPRVKLLNDLEAMAYGMLHLDPDELIVLNVGKPQAGNISVIAAGTGLGEAILYWDGERYQPIASEGGHCDFAPHTDQEIDLLKYLRKRFEGHVSWERILAGPGLHNVYDFLRDSGAFEESQALRDKLAAGDPSAAITQLGLAGENPLCAEALRLFVRLYGSEAGNLALKILSTGGVFIGGGIAPKMLPALQKGDFMEA